MAINEIFQGEDKTLTLKNNIDLSAATEIVFNVDTPTQIVKSLSAGQITAVTTTQMTVQIDAADTETVPAGGYRMQSRATLAGKLVNGKYRPNKITIRDSVFTTAGSGNDYN